jgi:hypothetical protein
VCIGTNLAHDHVYDVLGLYNQALTSLYEVRLLSANNPWFIFSSLKFLFLILIWSTAVRRGLFGALALYPSILKDYLMVFFDLSL